MARSIDYGNLMHQAMRGLIRKVLEDVAAHGLPGAHHFFITFDTLHPDVQMANWLRARYPTDMTIVLQHWYENLMVDEDGFTVTLNFGNQPEPMRIPYDALRTFVDPSVEFGLRFESHSEDDDEEDDALFDGPGGDDDGGDDEPPSPPKQGEVVRLDRFRKS